MFGTSERFHHTMPLPPFFRLRQKFDAPSLADPERATRTALAALPVSKAIRPGMTVAVTAGSRGISNYDIIVRVVCEELKKAGAQPFIVPAMGSHGGATDAGQLSVLAKYGITEQTMGVPIRSSMEVVELGRTNDFLVYQDRHAAGADAIVLVNRIKPHTDFRGPVESGLMKMATIGLGKQKGAHQFHQATVHFGHAKALLALGREVLRLSRIVFGVGIIENQKHETARIAAVPAATLEQEETQLLQEATRLMPRLPFDQIDLLIIDEIGKNLSGSGMDTNVVRRVGNGSFVVPGQDPVGRIYVRSLHPDSYGNAVGIGLADFIHDRLLKARDEKITRINAITALMPLTARVPMHFPTDHEALEVALQTTGVEPSRTRALWIRNTLSCERMLASEPFLAESRTCPNLEVESEPCPLEFDQNQDLKAVF